jgi:hypothetical protein
MENILNWFFLKKAVLNDIVVFLQLLIGVEGAKTPRKCYRIFFVRGMIRGSKINVLREYGAGETPQASLRGGSPLRPRKAKLLERKSTAKLT